MRVHYVVEVNYNKPQVWQRFMSCHLRIIRSRCV